MYDTYIYDEHPADRRHLRDLLVQYQIRSNVEADITACTFADKPAERALTAMYMTDAADSRCAALVTKLRAQKTRHHIVLTAPSFGQLVQAMTAQTLPTGLLLKPVGEAELFRLLQAVDKEAADAQDGDSYSWSVKARRYSIALEQILYFESRNKKTFLATNAQEYEVPASLDALEAQLGARFIRTHRSYLVNQRHILSYDAGAMTLTLDDESVVYLSRAGKARVKEVLAW